MTTEESSVILIKRYIYIGRCKIWYVYIWSAIAIRAINCIIKICRFKIRFWEFKTINKYIILGYTYCGYNYFMFFTDQGCLVIGTVFHQKNDITFR